MRAGVRALVLVTVAISIVVPRGPVKAQLQQDLSAAPVREAIRQGCDYLLNEQDGRGRWDEMTEYEGGVTALCTLALLNSGVEPSNP
jgi:hypothetical protein